MLMLDLIAAAIIIVTSSIVVMEIREELKFLTKTRKQLHYTR